MADKLIITSALTGAITIPTQTPHLPFTPEHLIADAIACGRAGAAAVHVHARDPVNAARLVLRETAPGVNMETIVAATEASLIVPEHVPEMPIRLDPMPISAHSRY